MLNNTSKRGFVQHHALLSFKAFYHLRSLHELVAIFSGTLMNSLIVVGDGACLVVLSGGEEYTLLCLNVVAKRK